MASITANQMVIEAKSDMKSRGTAGFSSFKLSDGTLIGCSVFHSHTTWLVNGTRRSKATVVALLVKGRM